MVLGHRTGWKKSPPDLPRYWFKLPIYVWIGRFHPPQTRKNVFNWRPFLAFFRNLKPACSRSVWPSHRVFYSSKWRASRELQNDISHVYNNLKIENSSQSDTGRLGGCGLGGQSKQKTGFRTSIYLLDFSPGRNNFRFFVGQNVLPTLRNVT